jgi:hypothetical protein
VVLTVFSSDDLQIKAGIGHDASQDASAANEGRWPKDPTPKGEMQLCDGIVEHASLHRAHVWYHLLLHHHSALLCRFTTAGACATQDELVDTQRPEAS